MKSQRIVKFEVVCPHLPLLRRAREGVDLEGVRSGSGKSLGCPRVETMMDCACDYVLYGGIRQAPECNCQPYCLASSCKYEELKAGLGPLVLILRGKLLPI
jgi:hypothetical protein